MIGDLIFTTLSNIFGVVGSLLFLTIFLLVTASITFSFSWLTVIDRIGYFSLLAFNSVYIHLKSSLIFLLDKVQTINIKAFAGIQIFLWIKPHLTRSQENLTLLKITLPRIMFPPTPPKAVPVEAIASGDENAKSSATVYKVKEQESRC